MWRWLYRDPNPDFINFDPCNIYCCLAQSPLPSEYFTQKSFDIITEWRKCTLNLFRCHHWALPPPNSSSHFKTFCASLVNTPPSIRCHSWYGYHPSPPFHLFIFLLFSSPSITSPVPATNSSYLNYHNTVLSGLPVPPSCPHPIITTSWIRQI